MFSGKTSELIRRIHRFEMSQRNVVLIKHAADTRYDEKPNACESITHDKKYRFSAIPANKLSEVVALQEVKDADVIGVDEGQFFEDLSQYCDAWANDGKIVIVSALDGDYRRTMFPSVSKTFEEWLLN